MIVEKEKDLKWHIQNKMSSMKMRILYKCVAPVLINIQFLPCDLSVISTWISVQ